MKSRRFVKKKAQKRLHRRLPDLHEAQSSPTKIGNLSGTNQLASVLAHSGLRSVQRESQIREISAWIEASSTEEERIERTGTFERLLQTVDRTTPNADFFAKLIVESRTFLRSGKCRDVLIKSLNQMEPHLFYYAEHTESSKGVLSRLGGLQPTTEVTFDAPLWYGCVAAVVGDDVYVLAGCNATDEVSVVNSIDGGVSTTTPMREKRRYPSAVGSLDGCRLLVFSGQNEESEFLYSCESFDVSTRRWTPLPPMPTCRCFTSALHVPGEGFFVVGGYNLSNCFRDVDVLSEDVLVWRRLEPMLEERRQPGVAFFQGRLVVAGGHAKTSVECLPLRSFGHRQWTRLAGFEGNRIACYLHYHSLVCLGEKLILSDDDGFVLEFSADAAASTSNKSRIETFSWKDLFQLENVHEVRLLGVRRLE